MTSAAVPSGTDTGMPQTAGQPHDTAPMEGFIPAGYVAPPAINHIEVEDVIACLTQGYEDFGRARGYGLFFASFYVLGGLGLLLLLSGMGMEYLLFPAMAGFLLIGPITAVGLYDISRRLENGEPLDTRAILTSFRRHGGKHLLLFGGTLVFLMLIWMRIAALIYALYYGLQPLSLSDMVIDIATTIDGFSFFVIGNVAGGVLAATVFAISAISVPMLLDRDVDFMTALVTSVRAVAQNPKPMFIWAAMIASMVAMSALVGMLGLFVTMPVIGHATWHLYRRLVVREPAEGQT